MLPPGSGLGINALRTLLAHVCACFAVSRRGAAAMGAGMAIVRMSVRVRNRVKTGVLFC